MSSTSLRTLAVTLPIAAALLLGSCSSSSNVEAADRANTGRKHAPDFSLKDANGATVKLSDYKGKVVLLDFWATWCGPCKIEIPWFMEFEKTYKDRKFAVLGVSMDDDGWSVVKPYVEKNRINYRILLGNENTGSLYGGVDSLPTTFLIDRAGRIASTHVGLSTSKSGFENEIKQLLDGR